MKGLDGEQIIYALPDMHLVFGFHYAASHLKALPLESIFSPFSGYAMLIIGGITIGILVWRINNAKASQTSIPEESFHELLSPSQSSYVQNVAAEALLLYAEETQGKVDIGDKIPKSMHDFIARESDSSLGFIKVKLAAAYVVFGSGQRDACVAVSRMQGVGYLVQMIRIAKGLVFEKGPRNWCVI